MRHIFDILTTTMNQVIFVLQIAVSTLIIIGILLQNRGSGLSGIFGGGGTIYRTKRGLERGLYIFTVALIILFVAIGVANLVIQA